MSEWITLGANELEDIGVGLWSIVPDGRVGFDLEGDAPIDFIRRYILELLGRGAKPVVAVGEGRWLVETKYGNSNEEIAENVIKDWLSSGAKDPEWGDYWFALPQTYAAKKNLDSSSDEDYDIIEIIKSPDPALRPGTKFIKDKNA